MAKAKASAMGCGSAMPLPSITMKSSLPLLAIAATWTVMALDWITADKQVLNPVRKFADGALSVITAACSLAGAVVVVW